MRIWEAAAWGIAGGFAEGGLQFAAGLVRTGRFPWQPAPTDHEQGVSEAAPQGADSPKAHLVAAIIRMMVSGIVVAALAPRLPDSFLALAVGITAPILVGRVIRAVRVADHSPSKGIPDGLAPPSADGGIPNARVPDLVVLPPPGQEAVAGTVDGL